MVLSLRFGGKPWDVQVYDETLPDVFPERLIFHGAKAVASTNKKELKGLAKEVWEKDTKEHPLMAIALVDEKSIKVNGTQVHYGVSEAYRPEWARR